MSFIYRNLSRKFVNNRLNVLCNTIKSPRERITTSAANSCNIGLPTSIPAIKTFSSSAQNDLDSPSQKLYPQHIPLTCLQKVVLGVGSGIGSLVNPYRGDLVADFGEVTGEAALREMYDEMMNDSEGLEVLTDKPRLNSKTVDFKKLSQLPKNTLGYRYSQFYIVNNVSPDTRKEVQFVDDAELAYVMQRYRELHDLLHTILDQPTTILGELIIKAFEAQQTGLFLCETGAIFGVVQLTPGERFEYIPAYFRARQSAADAKLLLNVYFEKRFEQDIDDLRRELSIALVDW